MTDAELLQLYLDRNGPDAAAHNLSPANLLFEYQTRRLSRSRSPRRGTSVTSGSAWVRGMILSGIGCAIAGR